MANAVITLKIMPTSPDVDMEALTVAVKEEVIKFAGEGETREEIEPIAFGLSALKITFVVDEANGSTDALEEKISALEHINSVECVDVRRAVG